MTHIDLSPELKLQIQQEVDPLEGWTSHERGWEVAELILNEVPLVCVELGVFGGRSLIPQAMALRVNGHGRVYGIDPWRVEPALEGENEANQAWWKNNVNLDEVHNKFMAVVWKLGLADWVTVIRDCSQKVANLFPTVHLLNIDGNHSEVASVRDVELWLPRVAKQGVITMDDTDWPSTQKAVELLKSQCEVIKDEVKYKWFRKR